MFQGTAFGGTSIEYVTIASVTQCVIELVQNSLDADCNNIAVRLDLSDLIRVQVVDNGVGITKKDICVIANRYTTSKCADVESLIQPAQYGYRGEALASMRDMAGQLDIVSRKFSTTHTHRVFFYHGKRSSATVTDYRPSCGTTVTVSDLFANRPVRRKLVNSVLELENVFEKLEAVALIFPNVAFSLRDDSTGSMLLQTRKNASTRERFIRLLQEKKVMTELMELDYCEKQYKVTGFVSKNTYHNSRLQFVYVNGRQVIKSRVNKYISSLISKGLETRTCEYSSEEIRDSYVSRQSEHHTIFLLKITCSRNLYDITFDPAKTLIEFQDWNCLFRLMTHAIKEIGLFVDSTSDGSIVADKSVMIGREIAEGTDIKCSDHIIPVITNTMNPLRSEVVKRLAHHYQTDAVTILSHLVRSNAENLECPEVVNGSEIHQHTDASGNGGSIRADSELYESMLSAEREVECLISVNMTDRSSTESSSATRRLHSSLISEIFKLEGNDVATGVQGSYNSLNLDSEPVGDRGDTERGGNNILVRNILSKYRTTCVDDNANDPLGRIRIGLCDADIPSHVLIECIDAKLPVKSSLDKFRTKLRSMRSCNQNRREPYHNATKYDLGLNLTDKTQQLQKGATELDNIDDHNVGNNFAFIEAEEDKTLKSNLSMSTSDFKVNPTENKDYIHQYVNDEIDREQDHILKTDKMPVNYDLLEIDQEDTRDCSKLFNCPQKLKRNSVLKSNLSKRHLSSHSFILTPRSGKRLLRKRKSENCRKTKGSRNGYSPISKYIHMANQYCVNGTDTVPCHYPINNGSRCIKSTEYGGLDLQLSRTRSNYSEEKCCLTARFNQLRSEDPRKFELSAQVNCSSGESDCIFESPNIGVSQIFASNSCNEFDDQFVCDNKDYKDSTDLQSSIGFSVSSLSENMFRESQGFEFLSQRDLSMKCNDSGGNVEKAACLERYIAESHTTLVSEKEASRTEDLNNAQINSNQLDCGQHLVCSQCLHRCGDCDINCGLLDVITAMDTKEVGEMGVTVVMDALVNMRHGDSVTYLGDKSVEVSHHTINYKIENNQPIKYATYSGQVESQECADKSTHNLNILIGLNQSFGENDKFFDNDRFAKTDGDEIKQSLESSGLSQEFDQLEPYVHDRSNGDLQSSALCQCDSDRIESSSTELICHRFARSHSNCSITKQDVRINDIYHTNYTNYTKLRDRYNVSPLNLEDENSLRGGPLKSLRGITCQYINTRGQQLIGVLTNTGTKLDVIAEDNVGDKSEIGLENSCDMSIIDDIAQEEKDTTGLMITDTTENMNIESSQNNCTSLHPSFSSEGEDFMVLNSYRDHMETDNRLDFHLNSHGSSAVNSRVQSFITAPKQTRMVPESNNCEPFVSSTCVYSKDGGVIRDCFHGDDNKRMINQIDNIVGSVGDDINDSHEARSPSEINGGVVTVGYDRVTQINDPVTVSLTERIHNDADVETLEGGGVLKERGLPADEMQPTNETCDYDSYPPWFHNFHHSLIPRIECDNVENKYANKESTHDNTITDPVLAYDMDSSHEASYVCKETAVRSSTYNSEDDGLKFVKIPDTITGGTLFIQPMTGNTVPEQVVTKVMQERLELESMNKLLLSQNQNKTEPHNVNPALNDGKVRSLWQQHMASGDSNNKWREDYMDQTTEHSDADESDRKSFQDLIGNWQNPIFTIPDAEVMSLESRGMPHAKHVMRLTHSVKFNKAMLHSLQVIGQVDRKFVACVCTIPANSNITGRWMVVFVDQHAAHERVRLERLIQEAWRGKSGVPHATRISPPVKLALTADQTRIIKAFHKQFSSIGVEVNLIDETVVSAPSCLFTQPHKGPHNVSVDTDNLQNLVVEQIEYIRRCGNISGTVPHTIHMMLASQACHGAIKFGDLLTTSECDNLIRDLCACDLPFQCAHGRPTMVPILDATHVAAVHSTLAGEGKPDLIKLKSHKKLK